MNFSNKNNLVALWTLNFEIGFSIQKCITMFFHNIFEIVMYVRYDLNTMTLVSKYECHSINQGNILPKELFTRKSIVMMDPLMSQNIFSMTFLTNCCVWNLFLELHSIVCLWLRFIVPDALVCSKKKKTDWYILLYTSWFSLFSYQRFDDGPDFTILYRLKMNFFFFFFFFFLCYTSIPKPKMFSLKKT